MRLFDQRTGSSLQIAWSPNGGGSRQDKAKGQFVFGPWQRTSAMDLSKKRIKMLCSALHGHPMEINWRLAEVLFEFGIPIVENSSDRSDSIAPSSIPIWNGLETLIQVKYCLSFMEQTAPWESRYYLPIDNS